MQSLKTLLLPVDFSPRSAIAAAHARVLARQFGARVVALHVMRPFQLAVEGADVPSAAVIDWYTQQRPLLQSRLAEFASIYLKECQVTLAFREGDPASEILEVAAKEKADLILISTRGAGPFRRFLLGSVAAQVLNDSPLPVLTGAHLDVPPSESEQIETVLVAVDLGPRTGELIAEGASLAKVFQAALHVVHCTPDTGAATEFLDPAWRASLADQIRERLDNEVALAAFPATVHIEPGEPAKSVSSLVTRLKADLLVIGRHADQSLLGRLHTHSYAIVRESACPVLSL